jgi:LAS superfamily LD-carboxypeptidase LdcB
MGQNDRMSDSRHSGYSGAHLTGMAEDQLQTLPDSPLRCHRAVVQPWARLVAAAARAGIELAAVSAYRSFAAQQALWDAKWSGERPVLDRAGRVLSLAPLSPAARMEAILVWSALPGASRHHWGTEFDVIDRAALPAGYRVQLVPAEYQPGGVFARLGAWLAQEMPGHGFHRPYQQDLGGVAPEPWHLSCTAVSREASRRFRLTQLRAAIAAAEMAGKEAVLANLPALYERFVRRVAPAR